MQQTQSVEVESSTEATINVEQTQSISGVEKTEERSVNVFVGLPGAGKTEGCHIAEKVIGEDVDTFEVSTFVRNKFQQETGDDDSGVSDNDLGRWAADMKEEHGNGYFVREMAKTIKAFHNTPGNINIAGVRSPAEADALREEFENVTIIVIWTHPDIRFDRLKEREGDYTREEFNERKQRELYDWGCIEFFTDENYYDYIIPNNTSLKAFRQKVEYAIRGTEVFQSSPFPSVEHFQGTEDFDYKDFLGQYL